MIARGGHHEMEVAITLLSVALRHDGFERGCRLLERGKRLGRVASQFAQPQAKPQQGIAIGMLL